MTLPIIGAVISGGTALPFLNRAYQAHSKIQEMIDPEFGCYLSYTFKDIMLCSIAKIRNLNIPSLPYEKIKNLNIQQINDLYSTIQDSRDFNDNFDAGTKMGLDPERLIPFGKSEKIEFRTRITNIGELLDERLGTALVGLALTAISVYCIYKAYQSYNHSHQQ